MYAALARMLFGKLIGSDEVKRQILMELRNAAAKTDTKIDDDAVDAFEVIWNVAAPILLGVK